MDIHKPKAAHSWREFLIEIGTIICGILIALGLEQAVEWAHWQERIHQTREALKQELHEAVVSADARVKLDRCDTNILDRVEAALINSGPDWRPPFVIQSPLGPGVTQAPKALWTSQAWRNAQADGSANHLPKDEALALGFAYEQLSKIRALNDQEASDLAELNSLAGVRRMDDASRTQYLRLLYRVRLSSYGILYYSRALIADAPKLGVEPARGGEYGRALDRYLEKCKLLAAGKTYIPSGTPDGHP